MKNIDGIMCKGVTRHFDEFITSWAVATKEGEFAHQSGDLEWLLGRKTKTFSAFLTFPQP